jgi:hypothetical protein
MFLHPPGKLFEARCVFFWLAAVDVRKEVEFVGSAPTSAGEELLAGIEERRVGYRVELITTLKFDRSLNYINLREISTLGSMDWMEYP